MSTYSQKLEDIVRQSELLEVEKFRTLEKAAKSDDPNDILAAAKLMVSQAQNKVSQYDPKSYLIDPLDFNSQLGYKDKSFSLTYMTLMRMSRVPVINAIIKTRKNQVADFAEPQVNRYNTGFIIQKKNQEGTSKLSKQDQKIANYITDFILNGGNRDTWDREDFDIFVRKVIEDSLVYDQMTFECIRNNKGQLQRFEAVDGATMRIAESYFKNNNVDPFFKDKTYWKPSDEYIGKKIKGYYPHYVQIYQTQKVNDFYPWELCFGIRNPSTNVHSNGYGRSELEDLINTVTSMLWGDEYNRRFFSQGSAPKGLLKINKGLSGVALEQFKQQWQAMVTGVMQSWKTPVVEADVEWIDLQKNNRDMEYTAWTEYLIKIACAIYSIDPSEIGWDISRSGSNHGLFEGNQRDRLRHSKDKGLYPLLKFLQRKLNKYIVEQINPDFQLVFMGLNGMTIEQELEMDIKKVNSFQTLNEIREKWDLDPVEDGDLVLNNIYYQVKMQKQNAAMQGGGNMLDDPFDDSDNPEGEDNSDYDETRDDTLNDNPFSEFNPDTMAKSNNINDFTDKEVNSELKKAFEKFLNIDTDDKL